MNKNVPTLLGIAVILLVAILAVLFYNIRLTQQLGQGATVAGTVGGQALTGVKQPTTEISPSEALARRESKTEVALSPRSQQQRAQAAENRARQQARGERKGLRHTEHATKGKK